MAYNCRLYENSGFNTSNSPDSPELLDKVPDYYDAPALDILQGGDIPVIRVACAWSIAKYVDYIKLYNDTETYYYSVLGQPVMEATDVAPFNVKINWVLSSGGVNSLNITDGITERVHVADDSYGLYNEDDELLTPTEILQLKEELHYPGTADQNNWIYIESTVNPLATEYAEQGKGYFYTDPASGETYRVDVPQVAYNEKNTVYNMGEYTSLVQPGTCLYGYENNADFEKAYGSCIATLRSLVLEQAILRQFTIPEGYVAPTRESATSEKYKIRNSDNFVSYSYISTMQGASGVFTPLQEVFNFNSHPNVKNNRLNYSNVESYGIISCTGESMESDPSGLYSDGATAPTISYIADPHPDGKPYFRFTTLNGLSSSQDFWRDCIAGMQWKEVPLMYTKASGSALNIRNFKNRQEVNRSAYLASQASYDASKGIMGFFLTDMLNSLGGDSRFSDIAGNYAGAAGNIITSLGSGALAGNIFNSLSLSGANSFLQNKARRQQYDIARRTELGDLYIANNVVAPTVAYPYNSEPLRDALKNGVLLYRYVYSDDDVQRIDKLLTMYGYKYTKPLEKTDFTNRTYFNFVKAHNVTVTGHPKYVNDEIADELSGGIRFWHVLPNTSYYTNNPIKEATA